MKRLLFVVALAAGLLTAVSVSFAQEVLQQPVQKKEPSLHKEILEKDSNHPNEDFRKDMMNHREDMRPEEKERMMKEGKDLMGRQGIDMKRRGAEMMQKEKGEQRGGEQQMKGGDEGNGENTGPSEEDVKRMEEQQKKREEQQFRQMKQGMTQFTQGVKRMRAEMTRLEKQLTKCGAALPDELKDAVKASEEAAPKVEAAKTFEELENVMDTVQENGELMREWGPKMGDLNRSCDMLKRADQDLKKMKSEATRLEKRVKAQKKFDLSEMLADYKAELDKLASALQKAKDLVKTDIDEALDILDDEFFGGRSDVDIARQALEMALDVTKGLKQSDSELKRYDRLIKNLEKQKKDVADLKEIYADLKQKQKEITDLVNKKKVDPEDLISLIEDAFSLRDDLVNGLEEFGAIKDFMPQFKAGPGVKFDLPPGFERQEDQQQSKPLEEGGQQKF